MKRLTTSGMAIAIALAVSSTPVFAQTQLENTVQNLLTEYGYEVDASTLTRSQLTALTAVDTDDTDVQVRATIESVITPDFQTMAVEAPQLREQADQLFTTYDVEADPNRLSLNQLAALTSVDPNTMTESQARASIYSIIGDAPDMAEIGAMEESQLEALAQTKFNEYGLDIDASTLDRTSLIAVLSVDESGLTSPQATAQLRSAAGM